MGFSYDSRPPQVSRGFAFGQKLFGFVLEGEGLLQHFGNVEGVEMSHIPHDRLQTERETERENEEGDAGPEKLLF